MKVILTEKVKSLGNVGEIVNVSSGYGRNYLIPNQMAVLADESNKAQAEHYKKSLAKKVEEQKQAAMDLKGKVDGVSLELVKRVGAGGKLFGTVTTVELSKILGEQGLDVERRHITLSAPIKALGSYEATAKLFSGVEATFKVNVVIDPAQAEELKEKEAEKAAQKAADIAAAKAAAEAGEGEGEEKKELTEEERLKAEADRLLRS